MVPYPVLTVLSICGLESLKTNIYWTPYHLDLLVLDLVLHSVADHTLSLWLYADSALSEASTLVHVHECGVLVRNRFPLDPSPLDDDVRFERNTVEGQRNCISSVRTTAWTSYGLWPLHSPFPFHDGTVLSSSPILSLTICHIILLSLSPSRLGWLRFAYRGQLMIVFPLCAFTVLVCRWDHILPWGRVQCRWQV